MASILITGAAGYVGANIARRLLADGHDVHALVRSSTDTGLLSTVLPPARQLVSDGDVAHLVPLFQSHRFDAVVHVAAWFLATHKPEQVDDLYRSNFLLGAALLEAAARAGTGLFVNTGSAWQHFRGREGMPVCLYAAQKNAFAEIAKFYADAFGLNVVDLLLFDTYGPADPRTKLINLLFSLARSGDRLGMSPGEQVMDLVHMDDVAAAFSGAVSQGLAGTLGDQRTFMVRSGRAVSLRQLVGIVEQVTGRKLDIGWGERPYREREVMAPWPGGTTLPGWRAEISLEDGLAQAWAS